MHSNFTYWWSCASSDTILHYTSPSIAQLFSGLIWIGQSDQYLNNADCTLEISVLVVSLGLHILRCNLLFGLIGYFGLLKYVNISFCLSLFQILIHEVFHKILKVPSIKDVNLNDHPPLSLEKKCLQSIVAFLDENNECRRWFSYHVYFNHWVL